MTDPFSNGFDEADATIGSGTSCTKTSDHCHFVGGNPRGRILRGAPRWLGDKSTLWTSPLPFVKRRRSSRWSS